MAEQVLRLVQPVDRNTVECLELLLGEAQAGRVIGLAYIALHARRDYTVDTAGECTRSPTFTRGCLRALDDQLAALVNGW